MDMGLAISSTMGSGLFTTCVLTASVLLIRPLEVEDRGAFVRDAGAYLVACLALLGFLWNNQLARLEALLLVLMYIGYVALALYSSRRVPYASPLPAIPPSRSSSDVMHSNGMRARARRVCTCGWTCWRPSR